MFTKTNKQTLLPLCLQRQGNTSAKRRQKLLKKIVGRVKYVIQDMHTLCEFQERHS